jgi:tannase/feruloyl esterase
MTSINVSIMIVGGVVALAASRQPQQSIPESASGGSILAAPADNRTDGLGPQSCASLASFALPEATITLAQSVSAGAFAPPRPFGTPGPRGALPIVAAADLPAFCRVAGTITPSTDSAIKFEVWMPASDWNGKFIGMGNGGFAGSIPYQVMGAPLSRHYAVAATDTGHEGAALDASFALGHRERMIDYAYRAVHEMTVRSKLILEAYYGRPAKFSYWNGCSCGGIQGFSEAARYPADYDGIIAGAPVTSMTHLQAIAVWRRQTVEASPDALVPSSKLAVLHKAVVDACDARDGVKDGVLEDPTRCDFDPRTLVCKNDEDGPCLTPVQVRSVETFYAPLLNPRTHAPIFPGLERGGELIWGAQAANGGMVAQSAYGRGAWLGDAVFQDPTWNYKAFDFDAGLARADQLDAGLMTLSPDLQKFLARGGKLLHYHGWSDPGISPRSSIDYYNSVVTAVGRANDVPNSYRLFMVPGMGHCFGGDGATVFDPIGAMERWVEEGRAPDRMIASRWTDGKVDRTRPLCPYPQVAEYKGAGTTDDAESFVCRAR